MTPLSKLVLVGQAVITEKNLLSLKKRFIVEAVNSVDQLCEVDSLADYDVIWIHFNTVVTDECVRKMKPTALLLSTTTGTTHITDRAERLLGSRLVTLREEKQTLEQVTSTAELSWSLLLSGLTNEAKASNSVMEGNWSREAHLRKKQVSSMKIGIIGYGRLGQMSAKIGRNIARKICVYEVIPEVRTMAEEHGFKVHAGISEFLWETDAVMLHASAQPKRAPIITHELLSDTSRIDALVNTARGHLVDEAAVVEALRNETLGFYGADVLTVEDSRESLRQSPVWNEFASGGNVQITPHIGGASLDAICSVEDAMVSQLDNLLKSQRALS